MLKKYGDRTPWVMYEEEVIKRFGAIYEDPIVEIKNLKQEKSIQQYQEAFESLLNKVELNEAYAVSLFIGGLKKEVSMPIRMFKLTTLSDVYAMAKMQEAANAVLKPRYNSPLLTTPKFTPNSVNKPVNAPFKTHIENGNNQVVARNGGNRPFKLTQTELEEKRAKNQCFYCDQRYFPCHKCSGQLHSLEVVSESYDELGMEGDDETFEDCIEEVITVDSNPHISLNALSGLNSFQTMRVKGMFGKHTLHNLVDCGSTHNFVDLKTAKSLGCKLESTTPLQVSVANGQNMMSCYECKNFQWSLKGETFTSDVMLLPLGSCEMVLGIQWLATLGDIQCNFKNLTMKFEHMGRKMVLRGTRNTTIYGMKVQGASKGG
ncbi:retrovirus-related pol polyprotein from transposon 17.6 [Tanacetum coccineum]